MIKKILGWVLRETVIGGKKWLFKNAELCSGKFKTIV